MRICSVIGSDKDLDIVGAVVLRKLAIIFFLFVVTSHISIAARVENVLTEESLQKDTSKIENFSIFYRADSITVDRNYLSNREQIERIRYYLANSPRIDSITIYAWSSPEGNSSYNRRLSESRAASAKAFILSLATDPRKLNAGKIILSHESENWAGLQQLVSRLYERPDRDAVLKILNDRSITDETRKLRLARLDGGKTWRYLIDNYMPELRAASWVCVWAPAFETLPVHHEKRDTLVVCHKGGLVYPKPEPVLLPVIEERRTVVALKTNLLYDAASLLNFSVEVPFCKDKFSVLYYHQCPWWTWGEADNEYCIRFLSMGSEARWWFAPADKKEKRDRLTGHFLGVYAESGKYDFEFGNKICRQGEFWSAGVSYGYSMPVGKKLNLEFSLSAGYASIAFRGYTPSNDYEILWSDHNKVGRMHYLGPTKAQISLVIPFTATYRKGGER